MRAMVLILAAMTTLVSLPTTAAAQTDIAGSWIITLISGQGPYPVPVTIVQDGQALTVTGQAGELGTIEMDGVIEGADVRFELSLDFQGTPVQIVFRGTVTEDSMSGTADFGGMGGGDWTAQRAED